MPCRAMQFHFIPFHSFILSFPSIHSSIHPFISFISVHSFPFFHSSIHPLDSTPFHSLHSCSHSSNHPSAHHRASTSSHPSSLASPRLGTFSIGSSRGSTKTLRKTSLNCSMQVSTNYASGDPQIVLPRHQQETARTASREHREIIKRPPMTRTATRTTSTTRTTMAWRPPRDHQQTRTRPAANSKDSRGRAQGHRKMLCSKYWCSEKDVRNAVPQVLERIRKVRQRRESLSPKYRRIRDQREAALSGAGLLAPFGLQDPQKLSKSFPQVLPRFKDFREQQVVQVLPFLQWQAARIRWKQTFP